MASVSRAKSSMNTREPLREHVGAKQKREREEKMKNKDKYLEDIIKKPEFEEVRKVHSSLNSMKGKWVDDRQPKEAKKIKKNCDRRKKNTYEEEVHSQNMASLKRRVGAIGSKLERQKNPHDPLVKPVLLFRHRGQEEED